MENNIVIEVNNVSMHFNMASERVETLKEYVVKALKHQLFYKDFIAVDNISFTIKKGEVFGIVGTNGSGKSTLLKLISGILTPTEGTVQTKGIIAPLIELGAGFDGELTARENIFLNGAILGYEKRFIEEKFSSIVDFADLWDFLDMPIKNYSSGMVARIAFAIATVVNPDILIVDEILSVGDFLFQQKCEKRIRELMGEGTTVVIVSHSIEQIESLCERVLWIEKSKMRMLGGTTEVCNAYRNLRTENVETVHEYQVVAHEKCFVCGKSAEFRNEVGMSLKTEAFCSECGATLHASDMAKIFLENELHAKNRDSSFMTQGVDFLRDKKILNCIWFDIWNKFMKDLDGYKVLSDSKKEGIKMLGFLPYEDESFDLIFNDEMMAYVEQSEQSFNELYRILKPNGVMILVVQINEGKKTKLRTGRKNIYKEDGLKVVTEWGYDISSYVEKSGFSVDSYKVHEFYSKDQTTDLDKQYEDAVNSHPYYFYKYNSIVMLCRKGKK